MPPGLGELELEHGLVNEVLDDELELFGSGVDEAGDGVDELACRRGRRMSVA